MGIGEGIGGFLDMVPFVRRFWRWLWERQMEVTIEPRYPDLGGPIHTVVTVPDGSTDFDGGWYEGLISLTLINNRTDRQERIIGIWPELRTRRLLFWKRTIAIGEAHVPDPIAGWPHGRPVTDLLLQPMSAPAMIVLNVGGSFKGIKLPKKSEIVLVFKMVGPMRRMTRKLTEVRHRPKR